MTMREDFETWRCEADDGPQTDPIWMIYDAAGNYGAAEIQRDWVTWQASRAALVVELPKAYRVCAVEGDHDAFKSSSVLSSLAASGIMVKS